MTKKRKKYSSQFKFKVALEAVKGAQTLNELASQNGVHPNQVGTWKKQLIEEGPTVFGQDTARQLQEQTEREAELYEQIGRLKMELEWLKKKLPRSGERKRMLIDPRHPALSIRRQCDLVGLSRASYYRQPAEESAFNVQLMNWIDQEYTRAPFYGYRENDGPAQQTARHPGQPEAGGPSDAENGSAGHLSQAHGPPFQMSSTRNTPICCVGSRLSDRTRFGRPTLPTYRCRTGLCIWSP